eukprot:3288692-Pyramimonas_sp.AAC.1
MNDELKDLLHTKQIRELKGSIITTVKAEEKDPIGRRHRDREQAPRSCHPPIRRITQKGPPSTWICHGDGGDVGQAGHRCEVQGRPRELDPSVKVVLARM